MGIIMASMFTTIDGVYQAPGAPDEDPSGGFAHGGWQAPFAEAESGAEILADIERLDALLLGRRTYDIFAAYWPAFGDSNPIAAKFNAVPKFVASRTLTEPAWAGTEMLTDAAEQAGALRDRFERVHVIGSGDLLRTLLDAGVVDELKLWVYPVALGSGKRLFDGAMPATYSLAGPPRTYESGAFSATYSLAGPVVTGEMGPE
ncbi:dihydrofolate reductase family protein [Agromyces mangrovi Wang et al. 2018]|uniref:dihydrofolate reductase family protein n=1 Tax=Agromyces mangrovi TaxID=1858653 RepID=UPI00257412D6|nr:dihydrofolate reductase family protein [Agromyces mangrovi]BDZ65482.1 deaminase reductase [Agromyces mangrovi]